MTSRTLAAVDCATAGESLMTRLTVAIETPAVAATSRMEMGEEPVLECSSCGTGRMVGEGRGISDLGARISDVNVLKLRARVLKTAMERFIPARQRSARALGTRGSPEHFFDELRLARVIDIVCRDPGDKLARGPGAATGGDAVEL